MSNLQAYQRAQRQFFTYLATHLALGIGVGWLVLTAFLIIDVGGLRSSAFSADAALVVFPALYMLFAITFGSAGMGMGIMSLGQKDRHDDDNHKGGRKRPVLAQLIPIRIGARTTPRRRK